MDYKLATDNHFTDAFVYMFNNLKLNKMNYEITEEQINELAKGNAKVKKWFPEVFETKFTNGWYKHKNNEFKEWLAYTDFTTTRYGFNAGGKWMTGGLQYELDYIKAHCEPATDTEVLEALTNEFKKQNPNVKFDNYFFDKESNVLRGYNNNLKVIELFKNGIFTKFHTKEEAEKMLNAKII